MSYLFHEFTEHLIKELTQHHALNLFGLAEYGRERVLQDIKDYPPDNTLVLLINMKVCRQRYASFLQAIWEQAGNKTLKAQALVWRDVIHALEKHPKQVFLLLENFDALMDTVELDDAYQLDFLDNLNALKNAGKIKLVCATGRRYNQRNFYLGQTVVRPSNLDIPTCIKIEKGHFGQKKIIGELARYHQNFTETQQKMLQLHLEKQPYPYAFLRYIELDLKCLEQLSDDELTQQLKKWDKSFKQNHKMSLTHWIDKTTSALACTAKFLIFQLKKLRYVLPLITLLKGLKDNFWKNNKNQS